MATDERKPLFSFSIDRESARLGGGVTPQLERYMAGAIEALLQVAAFGGNLTLRSDKDRIRVNQYALEDQSRHQNGATITSEVASSLFNGAARVIETPPPAIDPEVELAARREAKLEADREKERQSREARAEKQRKANIDRKAKGIYYPSEMVDGKAPKWGKFMQAGGQLSEFPDALRELPEEMKGLPLREIPVAKSPLPLKIMYAVMRFDPNFTLGDLDALNERHLQKIPGISKRHYPVIREAILLAGARQ